MASPEPGEVWRARVYFKEFLDSGRPKSEAVEGIHFKPRYCIIIKSYAGGVYRVMASSGKSPRGGAPSGATLLYSALKGVPPGIGVHSPTYWYGHRVGFIEQEDLLRETRHGVVPEPTMTTRVRPAYDGWMARQEERSRRMREGR